MPSNKVPCPKCGKLKVKKAKTCRECAEPNSGTFKKGEGKTGTEVKCESCGNWIYKSKSWLRNANHHYCSNKCRQIGSRKGKWNACKKCGKEFYVRKGNLERGFGIYCCKKCWYADHNIEIICEVCGNKYIRKKSAATRFCSRECQAKGVIPWNKGRTGEYSFIDYKGKNGEYKNCLYCDEKFYAPKHRIAMGMKCCSSEHQRLYEIERNAKPIKCMSCGKDFWGKLRKCANTYPLFCNIKCMRDFDGAQVECAQCGKPHRRSNSKIINTKHHFCSNICWKEWNQGSHHSAWRGGFSITSIGHKIVRTDERYINITKNRTLPAHKYRAEHRIIAEKYIGRKLKYKSEPILHLNGLPNDNKPENLYVCESFSECTKIVHGGYSYPRKSNLDYLREEVLVRAKEKI